MFDNDEMLRGDAFVPRAVWRLIYSLPDSGPRRSMIHGYRRKRFHDYLAGKLGANFSVVEPGAIPPLELVLETNVLDEAEVAKKGEPREYVSGAYLGMLNFLHILERCGVNFRTVGSMLDFGCGTAINLRLFRCVPGLRLVGTDVNPKMIEWCKENVAGVEFHVNDLEPPLAFADESSFDLIVSASVFTHIPLELQGAWLEEMRRVLRPGGHLICTVAGSFHMSAQLSQAQQASLAETGELTLDSEDAGVSLATKNAGSWDVFQIRSRVVESFGGVLDLVDYVATGGQDVLVLRKPKAAGLSGTGGGDSLLGAGDASVA